jgi:tripartite-type tricarboxylate transporter receptor subunit TctC
MPGAAGLTSSNWMYNVAPRDGTTIGIMLMANAIDGLFGESKVLFDATKLNWLGNMDVSIGTCVVMTSSGIATFDDLLKTETLFGSTGPTGGNTQHALALKNLFGAKIKLISGYDGGGAIKLAMERGEVAGTCGIPTTNLNFQWRDEFNSGKIKVLIHDFNGKVADIPGVPSVYDYAKTEADRQAVDIVFGWHEIGRPVIAPPEVPADRLQALKAAFEQTMKDADFLAEAKKLNLTINPSSGDAIAAKVKTLFGYPNTVIERASNAVRTN